MDEDKVPLESAGDSSTEPASETATTDREPAPRPTPETPRPGERFEREAAPPEIRIPTDPPSGETTEAPPVLEPRPEQRPVTPRPLEQADYEAAEAPAYEEAERELAPPDLEIPTDPPTGETTDDSGESGEEAPSEP
jgi:hypothetical protein